MTRPPQPPSLRPPPSDRKLVISPHVTVQWVQGTLRVKPREGNAIETRDSSMLWLLHEFATPRLPKQVANSLPGTAPTTLETAIADLRGAGILVPAMDRSDQARRRSHRARKKTIPGLQSKQLTASVVLPVAGEPRFLDYTLASLLCQSDERFEVIVVDYGGDARVGKILGHYDSRLVIHHLQEDCANPAAARNVGLAQAEGDIAIFSDDDRIVAPGFVEQHLGCYEGPSDDRFVLGWIYNVLSVVDPDLLGPMYPVLKQKLSGARQHRGGTVAMFEPADLAEHFEETVAEFGAVTEEWEPHVLPVVDEFGEELEGFDLGWFFANAGNLSAPAGLVREAGGFDDQFEGVGLEHTDLAYALTRSGARARIDEQASSYHQAHAEPSSKHRDRRSLRYFAKKHRRLEAQLYLWWRAGGIDPVQANRIVRAAKSVRGAADPTLAALENAVGELLRIKLER